MSLKYYPCSQSCQIVKPSAIIVKQIPSQLRSRTKRRSTDLRLVISNHIWHSKLDTWPSHHATRSDASESGNWWCPACHVFDIQWRCPTIIPICAATNDGQRYHQGVFRCLCRYVFDFLNYMSRDILFPRTIGIIYVMCKKFWWFADYHVRIAAGTIGQGWLLYALWGCRRARGKSLCFFCSRIFANA